MPLFVLLHAFINAKFCRFVVIAHKLEAIPIVAAVPRLTKSGEAEPRIDRPVRVGMIV